MSGPLTGHGFQFSIVRQRYVPARGSLVRLQPEALMIIRVRHGPLVEPATRARQRHIHGVVHLMCLRMANLAVVCGGAFEVRVPRHAGPSPPMGDSMYKVCSTSGCPHLVSSGSLCDECRKAKDKRRSRGRNPYTSKAHRLARARVLARDPRCVCPGDGPDGCGRHHGLCGAPSTIADHWPLERVELIEAGLDPNDPTRMRGLCKRCHDSKTARTKPSGFNGRSLR